MKAVGKRDSKIKFIIKKGDVFCAPFEEKRFAYGQVVEKLDKRSVFVCFFKKTSNSPNDLMLDEIINSGIALAGNTFDALFQTGKWQIIKNIDPIFSEANLPNYKYGDRKISRVFVEDFYGKRNRPCSEKEEQLLSFRRFVSPALFEELLRNYNGFGKWNTEYDDLTYDYILKSKNVKI